MATVTNNTRNPVALAGVHIPVGETAEVTEFDSVKDSPAVKALVKGGAISLGDEESSDEAKPSDGLKVDEIKAELEKRGIAIPDGVTKKPELAKLLDDSVAKSQQG